MNSVSKALTNLYSRRKIFQRIFKWFGDLMSLLALITGKKVESSCRYLNLEMWDTTKRITSTLKKTQIPHWKEKTQHKAILDVQHDKKDKYFFHLISRFIFINIFVFISIVFLATIGKNMWGSKCLKIFLQNTKNYQTTRNMMTATIYNRYFLVRGMSGIFTAGFSAFFTILTQSIACNISVSYTYIRMWGCVCV